MEFSFVFLPIVALFLPTALWCMAAERRLARSIRGRYPSVFEDWRGRPRKWHDESNDEMLVHMLEPGRKIRALTRERASGDAAMQALLDEVERRRMLMWRALAVGVAGMVLLILWTRWRCHC